MAGEPVEVGQFVSFARQALVNEPYLSNAAIIGELTKVTFSRSGHTYFTLTDPNGSIDCVLFGGNASFTLCAANSAGFPTKVFDCSLDII